MSVSRREFLGVSGAAIAGLTLAPGLRLIDLATARSPEEAASTLQRWGLLIDTNKCGTGCSACVTACNDENGLTGHGRPETDAQWIRTITLKDKQTGVVQTLPMMCQHCETPPCVDVCPTGASFKREDGIVLVDKHICIGCRYCMMACPYKARSFIHEDLTDQKPHAPRGKGTVESCTLCVHRVDKGQIPACVEACSVDGSKAMVFGDMKDPNSEISQRLASQPSKQVRADLALNTGVRYQGL
jgi:molybdopterin-containing oxidoreductase family iron-sulfur binding subunit